MLVNKEDYGSNEEIQAAFNLGRKAAINKFPCDSNYNQYSSAYAKLYAAWIEGYKSVE
jgi:hypothetical protein